MGNLVQINIPESVLKSRERAAKRIVRLRQAIMDLQRKDPTSPRLPPLIEELRRRADGNDTGKEGVVLRMKQPRWA